VILVFLLCVSSRDSCSTSDLILTFCLTLQNVTIYSYKLWTWQRQEQPHIFKAYIVLFYIALLSLAVLDVV